MSILSEMIQDRNKLPIYQLFLMTLRRCQVTRVGRVRPAFEHRNQLTREGQRKTRIWAEVLQFLVDLSILI